MKPKTTILMVLAIGCGLAAAFMTNKLIADRGKEKTEVETVQVLVAKKKIPAMTYIKKVDDFFELQDMPKTDVLKNAITDPADKEIKDGFRVAKAFQEKGQLIRDDLITKGMDGLAREVPEGMRAIATRVTAESLVGGFVLPGSKVDVVWTSRSATGEGKAQTIFQNVLVLAVAETSGRNPDSPQTILGGTVSMAFKPEDAMKLKLAAENGVISLSLRSPGDVENVQLPEAKLSDLGKSSSDTGKREVSTDTTAAPSGFVPPIPAVVKAPTVPETPKPVVEEKPVVKPVTIHTLKIEDGQNKVEFKYPYNEETKSYGSGSVTRSEVDSNLKK